MAKPDLNVVGGLLPDSGYEGQVSRLSESIIDSKVNSGETALSAGKLVGRDPTNPNCCRLALVGDELLGPVVRDPVTRHADSDGNVTFPQYRSVAFLRFGYIKITPVEQVRAGDGLIAIFTDGVFSGYGGTGTGGISPTRRLVNGFKWETNTAANASSPGEVSALATGTTTNVTY